MTSRFRRAFVVTTVLSVVAAGLTACASTESVSLGRPTATDVTTAPTPTPSLSPTPSASASAPAALPPNPALSTMEPTAFYLQASDTAARVL